MLNATVQTVPKTCSVFIEYEILTSPLLMIGTRMMLCSLFAIIEEEEITLFRFIKLKNGGSIPNLCLIRALRSF